MNFKKTADHVSLKHSDFRFTEIRSFIYYYFPGDASHKTTSYIYKSCRMSDLGIMNIFKWATPTHAFIYRWEKQIVLRPVCTRCYSRSSESRWLIRQTDRAYTVPDNSELPVVSAFQRWIWSSKQSGAKNVRELLILNEFQFRMETYPDFRLAAIVVFGTMQLKGKCGSVIWYFCGFTGQI